VRIACITGTSSVCSGAGCASKSNFPRRARRAHTRSSDECPRHAHFTLSPSFPADDVPRIHYTSPGFSHVCLSLSLSLRPSVRLSVCLSYSNISLPRRPKHSAVARNVWSAVSLGQSIFTHRRIVPKRGGCFQRRLFVCQCVCQFVRTITSQRLNVGRSKLGG